MGNIINKFGIAIAMLMAAGAVVYAESTFMAPSQAPPGGNTDPPINEGMTNQTKNGGLGVNSLAVFNDMVVRGGLDVTAGYSKDRVPGISRTCLNGKVLANPLVAGGILTGGDCAAVSDLLGGGGSASSGDGIPSGMIAMFDVACPSEWTRFAALDNRFPLGGNSYGTLGGASETGSGIWPVPYGAGNGAGGNPKYNIGPHTHAVPYPPYLTVVWCKKN